VAAVLRASDLVSLFGEHLGERLSEVRVVFDDEDLAF
jgi:hypothetical protein